MRVLMVTDTPFAGLLHRPQQLAIGMARQGHEVLYLAPGAAYHHTYDPDRYASEASSADVARADPPASEANLEGMVTGQTLPPQLQIRELPGDGGMQTATSLKEAWRLWADLAARQVRQLADGPAAGGRAADGRAADGRAPNGPAVNGQERFSPEVIYCDHPGLLPAIKDATTAPVVLDCSEDFEAQTSSRSAIEAYREALSTALPVADGLIAHNRYVIESWDRYLGEGVPSAVIEHGVDADLFRPTPSERAAVLRRELELRSGRPAITFLGHVDARISYEDLVTMMETAPEAVFIFVGQVRPDGLSLLQRLPRDRVRPLGALRPDRAAEIVGASDALILPFRREPHLEVVRGLNLYEYFATGRPIAASFRRALKAYRDLLYLYTTQAELQQAVRALLDEPESDDKVRRRIEIAREAAWSRRVDELIAFLGSAGERRTS